ncbi:MAG: lytic transglycosylase domain-containing protein, partial [Burkholderiaceae bacterium]|nr:lytic transglycosylase domain-containing protein [Burkholderiaceae bacterium]
DADSAAYQLENKWGPQLTAEERNWVWGVIGRQVAIRLTGDAMVHFDKVTRDADLSQDMLAWKVRAALRAGAQPRWPAVLSAIDAMEEGPRRDSTWVYWKARALKARAAAARTDTAIGTDAAQAQALLESIASPRGFYEQLASEELGRKISTPPRPAPLTAEEREAARRNPSLVRGLQAIALGLRSEGVREWNYGANLAKQGGMSERELLAAAQFACDREVWDRCINTSERTRTEVDFEQRFPMPFRDAVLKRTREIALDPAYVYGLIRQESRFIMDARSGVGASGLMQVMPATARWTARKIGLSGFTTDKITDRDTNIAIGTAYLKLVLDDFAGSLPLAAAAYNAGPGRPRNWRNGPVLEAAIWAENVPFNETRDYVKKVLSNTT